ncbi:FAD:protein FMN transferase [Dyella koreensis]|uniref:FAD:protein FMN transferase n=1 Tax=Dyella koreensis TaxID=311235 RepID=A0ABW8K6P6_9GAMM
MHSSSPRRTVERARPLLGTTVSIRVEHADELAAHRAIDAAFAAVAGVHGAMSFHEADSDLARLHRTRCGVRVQLTEQTAEVLREALKLAALSDGVFDVSIATQLVAWGLLPRPVHVNQPVPDACWRDIHLDEEHGVRLERPLWIDLGGIAKGYAVDRAVEALRVHGIDSGCVNAGGDLRTLGGGPHHIAIDTGEATASHHPVLELGEAAVATSHSRALPDHAATPHVHGQARTAAGRRQCATVVAERCIHADALTKLVLALGPASTDLLLHYDATAYWQDDEGRWTTLGTTP